MERTFRKRWHIQGVTQRTYNAYLGRNASKDELRHIPDGLDFAVFDTAVSTGPARIHSSVA